ncbi:MAG TPA: DNA repair protein RadC [Casimicrobiaceae bacterium]|jgi:DNA repair protein RadC
MNIGAWPRSERPRERLLARGAASLSDAELLSIVLRTGVRGSSSLDVAHDLLARHRSLTGLLDALGKGSPKSRGVGLAKIAQLKAGVELARRLLAEEIRAGSVLTSPEAVRDYLRLSLADLPHETFVVLFLDSQHRLLAADPMFRGTLAQTSVYPREVVKAALAHNAAAVIFAHNHPSGVAEPSRADELLTQTLKQALALVDIRTLDHFVVAGNRVVSFAERGIL